MTVQQVLGYVIYPLRPGPGCFETREAEFEGPGGGAGKSERPTGVWEKTDRGEM